MDEYKIYIYKDQNEGYEGFITAKARIGNDCVALSKKSQDKRKLIKILNHTLSLIESKGIQYFKDMEEGRIKRDYTLEFEEKKYQVIEI